MIKRIKDIKFFLLGIFVIQVLCYYIWFKIYGFFILDFESVNHCERFADSYKLFFNQKIQVFFMNVINYLSEENYIPGLYYIFTSLFA